METKEHLKNKLQSVNNQLLWNGIITIIAIAFILFFPLTSFDANNFRININLEWIIAFIVMIVGIVRAFTLRSKKKDIEDDLSFHNKKNELKWKCDFCGKKFKTKEEAEKHEKNCKDKDN
jgi:cytochrome bd-type quinol oxidase subunit 2